MPPKTYTLGELRSWSPDRRKALYSNAAKRPSSGFLSAYDNPLVLADHTLAKLAVEVGCRVKRPGDLRRVSMRVELQSLANAPVTNCIRTMRGDELVDLLRDQHAALLVLCPGLRVQV